MHLRDSGLRLRHRGALGLSPEDQAVGQARGALVFVLDTGGAWHAMRLEELGDRPVPTHLADTDATDHLKRQGGTDGEEEARGDLHVTPLLGFPAILHQGPAKAAQETVRVRGCNAVGSSFRCGA